MTARFGGVFDPPGTERSLIQIGIVCGMEAEAKVLGNWRSDPSVFVGISGAVPERAAALASEAADAGAHTLISWGLAGGLSEDIASGSLVQPGAVVMPDGSRLEFQRGMMGDVAMAGSETVLTSPASKADLLARTGAIAVDMETHRLAQIAMDRGLSLRIVRAISDPFDRSLPEMAATALGPDGRPRVGRVLLGLLKRPWDLPALLSAKDDADRALSTLSQVADQTIRATLKPSHA